jgi:GNAT superfamily N-acetyltransferase
VEMTPPAAEAATSPSALVTPVRWQVTRREEASPTEPLVFRPLSDFAPGTVASLLAQSYAELAAVDPRLYDEWKRGWEQFDGFVHRHPDVGRCAFVSCQGETPIGFGAWDPRGSPTARIGHNCIVPAFRGLGYGERQLNHTLACLREGGFTTAVAWAGDGALFAPARRMYERCGFIPVRTNRPAPGIPFATTDYQLAL